MSIHLIRQFVLYFVGLFLALVLAGCGNAKPTTPPTLTPQPKPSSTNQPTWTITPTPSATPKPSVTQRPSSTMLPSATPTVTATTNLTQVAFETSYAPTVEAEDPSFELTMVAKETWRAAFSDKCESSNQLSISPDGNWAAESCGYYVGDSKIVVATQDGKEWAFRVEDYLRPEDSVNMASAGLILQTWSPDSRYLFFSSKILERDGGGICFYGSFGDQGLFRLDVQTGKVSTILALLDSNHTGYIVEFSPTGRRFAYTRGENEFHIVDMRTAKESIIQTENPNGSLTWSPDGSALAFSTSECDYEHDKVIHSIIKVLQIADLSVKTVFQSDKEFLRVDHWVSNSFLVVESYTTVEDLNDGYRYIHSLFTIDVDRSAMLFSTTDAP